MPRGSRAEHRSALSEGRSPGGTLLTPSPPALWAFNGRGRSLKGKRESLSQRERVLGVSLRTTYPNMRLGENIVESVTKDNIPQQRRLGGRPPGGQNWRRLKPPQQRFYYGSCCFGCLAMGYTPCSFLTLGGLGNNVSTQPQQQTNVETLERGRKSLTWGIYSL